MKGRGDFSGTSIEIRVVVKRWVMAVAGTYSGTPEMIRQNCIVFGFYYARDVTGQVRDANCPILRNTIDTYRQRMKEGKLEICFSEVQQLTWHGGRRRPLSGDGRKNRCPLMSRAREQTPMGRSNKQPFHDESRGLRLGKTHSTTIRAAPVQGLPTASHSAISRSYSMWLGLLE